MCGFRTIELGNKIGEVLGEVEDVGVFDLQGSKAPILKAKVRINLGTPLRRGINIGNRADGAFWIDFRYERLPQFCYHCGVIGHEEDECKDADGPCDTDDTKEYGPWLRTLNQGRRIKIIKNASGTHFHSNAEYEDVGGVKAVFSEDILKKLSEMTVEQEEDLDIEKTTNRNVTTDNRNTTIESETLSENVVCLQETSEDVNSEVRDTGVAEVGDALPIFSKPDSSQPSRNDIEEVNKEGLESMKAISKGKKWKRMAQIGGSDEPTGQSNMKRSREALGDISNYEPMDIEDGKKQRTETSLLLIGNVGGTQHGRQS